MEEKKWWGSKTVIGALVAVAASAASLTGIVLDVETQIQLTDCIFALTGVVGGLVAVYGRIKASKKVV